MTSKKTKVTTTTLPDDLSPEDAAKRLLLEQQLYAIAGDADKADEFEALRLELSNLG